MPALATTWPDASRAVSVYVAFGCVGVGTPASGATSVTSVVPLAMSKYDVTASVRMAPALAGGLVVNRGCAAALVVAGGRAMRRRSVVALSRATVGPGAWKPTS